MSAPANTPTKRSDENEHSTNTRSVKQKVEMTSSEPSMEDQLQAIVHAELAKVPVTMQTLYKKNALAMPAAASSAKASKPKLFWSFDVEADGASPAVSSMVSFGLEIFSEDGKSIDGLQMNLLPVDGHVPEERCTREFWDKNPHIKEFCGTNQREQRMIAEAIRDLLLKYKNYKNIWIARPAGYDHQWLNCVYDVYRDPSWPSICVSPKCISTLFDVYAKLCLDAASEDATKAEILKSLEEPGHVAHNPQHDARVQGKFFFEICRRLGIQF